MNVFIMNGNSIEGIKNDAKKAFPHHQQKLIALSKDNVDADITVDKETLDVSGIDITDRDVVVLNGGTTWQQIPAWNSRAELVIIDRNGSVQTVRSNSRLVISINNSELEKAGAEIKKETVRTYCESCEDGYIYESRYPEVCPECNGHVVKNCYDQKEIILEGFPWEFVTGIQVSDVYLKDIKEAFDVIKFLNNKGIAYEIYN